jgi:hypothetical protein
MHLGEVAGGVISAFVVLAHDVKEERAHFIVQGLRNKYDRGQQSKKKKVT